MASDLDTAAVDSSSESEEKTYYDKVTKNQYIFDEEFGLLSRGTKRKSSVVLQTKLNEIKEEIRPSSLTGFIPILRWLPGYNVKENLINDIIGGLTVGIMHVPQGMAYAALAGMKPVNGLYTSLFPPLFYMLFGTSRHVSLGVFAVVSLMVGSCNLKTTQFLFEQRFAENGTDSLLDEALYEEQTYDISVEVVTSLALLVGLIQIALGLLRLDFLTYFLSDQVIAGFTTGAAVHVFTAQLNKILGVSLPRANGAGKLFVIYRQLWGAICAGHANGTTFIISVFTITTLFVVKNFVDPVLKKKLNFKLPIPYDLFVMIFGTIFSFFFGLRENYAVKVIGVIPTGLPAASIPNVLLLPILFADAIAISVVILVVTISMGKLFAKKHNYTIDVRQEFYALGVMECLSSLFPVWPSSTALARTLVYEAAGTKTQLATVFSSVLLLIVIFWIGPFVEVLPTCLLSCIIIVALKGMFMQFKQIGPLWRVNRGDAAAFLVAFFATVVFDVVEGLTIGVLFVLGQIILRTQRAPLVELGRMSHSREKVYFQPISKYRDAIVRDGIVCLRFSAPLVFLNVDDFRRQLSTAIEAPSVARSKHLEMQAELKRLEVKRHSRNNSGATVGSVKLALAREGRDEECVSNKLSTLDSNKISLSPIRAAVIDMSGVPFVDFMGGNTLIEIFTEHKKSGVQVLISGVNLDVMSTLKKIDRFKKEQMDHFIFPSIEDALQAEENGIKINEGV